jgi:hypothetical protein
MSTAIAEPPPTEAKTVTPPPAEQKTALVESLLRPNVVVKDSKGAVVGETKPKQPDAKPSEKPVESKSEEVKPTEQELNFKALREKTEAVEKTAKEREEAIKLREKELADLRAEYDTFKKNPIPKEFEEKLTAAEKRAQELDSQLRVAALSRHPEFQRKYNDGIKQQAEGMASMAKAIGIDPKEIQEALGRWDTTKFSEWFDAMDRPSQIRFQGFWGRAEQLDTERLMELENAEKTYGEMEKAQKSTMEKAQQDYVDGLRKEKTTILGELESSQELVKNDPALRAEIETLIDRAARLNGEPMQPGQILRSLANAHVLARHFERVSKEKADLSTELEGVKKTLAERDAFITKMNGGIPTPGPTGEKPAGDEKKALLQKLFNPTVRIAG